MRIYSFITWVGEGYAEFKSPLPGDLEELADLEAGLAIQIRIMRRMLDGPRNIPMTEEEVPS